MEVLVLSKLGSNYELMFSITGVGSVIAAFLLIFAFDAERFKPDFKRIFVKSATAKYYRCKVKKNPKMAVEASYHNLVSNARERLGSVD